MKEAVTAATKWPPFETRVPGKWVLSGEHAVLRGVAAVALPHPELGLSLKFEPRAPRVPGPPGCELEILPSESSSSLREILSALPGAREIAGVLRIQSTIPWGAGLGSSAALCVALTRWLSGPLGIEQAEWLDFATGLENRFHGKSSGMDIAVILAGEPIRFFRGRKAEPLGVRELPRFTFHDTGLRARTSDCVARVGAFALEHPLESARLDQLMAEASREAQEGLKLAGTGLAQIARAMDLSHQCFEGWGLVPPSVRELRQALLSQGARAAKLTGAGGGGMLVALWDGKGFSDI